MEAIVINHNEHQFLEKCISSLHRFGIERVILITHSLLSDIEGVEKVILTDNNGYSTAINVGMQNTKSSVVAVMNADVEVKKGRADEVLKIMENLPDVGVIGPRILDGNGKFFQSFHPFPTPLSIIRETFFPFIQNRVKKDGWISGCCFFVKREAFEEAGGFDENFFLFWEEVDFMKRLCEKNWKVKYYPKVEVIHYGGKFDRAFKIVEWHKSLVYYFRKHGKANLVIGIAILRACLRLGGYFLLLPFKREIAKEKVEGYWKSLKYLWQELLKK